MTNMLQDLIEKQIKLLEFLREHPELQGFQDEVESSLSKPHLTSEQKCIILQTKLIEQRKALQTEMNDVQVLLGKLEGEIQTLIDISKKGI